ncbi:MAG TPA: hypothetical protein VLD67_03725 [Vicinamibacterales bacterium]|nr:hypothetical protein [Vicinamibacterales bacterium]
MHFRQRITLTALCLGLPAFWPAPAAQSSGATQAASTESAKTWIERRAEIEEYLKTAKVVKLTDIGVGVTNPKRADLEPGGLVAAMAWKPIRPGIYSGFWESYKSEIAAYELDKLLGLDMIPPTVERRVNNDTGAAVMWAAPTKSFKELGGLPKNVPAEHFVSWNRQLTIAKMFDNLIYNKDPNLGNWLVDPAWNLILIDHTRAFTSSRDMVHEMTRIDAELWDRMKALTEESLKAAIGNWMGGRELRAILQRRDRMQQIIDKMVAERGAASVFVK